MDDPSGLAALRREYSRAGLREEDLAASWHAQFAAWFAQAREAGIVEPNALVLGTASAQGRPSARTVLLKAYDERGFVVFTNLTSRKGNELADNPWASMVFPWIQLERQVVVEGSAERLPQEESAAYFRTRPRAAQIGAWASRQSSVLASRDVLEQRSAELEERFAGGEVPVPGFWGGVRVVPSAVEFWQGRPGRLHDRLRFRRADDGAWVVERLAP